MKGKNIILIGFMGTGKTTVGEILAQIINYRFLDVDAEIVREAQMSIPDIFLRYGEKYFRMLESQCIKRLLQYKGVVIATGAGAVTDKGSLSLMLKNGSVIALDASIDTIWNRLKDLSDRPMLFHENPMERIIELYKMRQPLYEKAHFKVMVDNKKPREIAREILEYIITGKEPLCSQREP